MKNLTIKQQLYTICEDFLSKRLEVIQNTILEIQKSLESETKSSAGDKHETGRAMLQIEREKAGQQLSEIQKLQELLKKIDTKTEHEKVGIGSLVFTSDKNYYIAISAGEIKISDTIFYAISAATPIAKLLLGKVKDDAISFRSSTFVITKVL